MYILDSDGFSHISRYGQQKPLGRRIATLQSSEQPFLSIITVEEALEGRLKQIRNSNNFTELARYYGYLQQTFDELKKYEILPFSDEAQRIYDAIPRSVKKDRAHDCRIAAIAVSVDMTVLTMNTEDFSRIKEVLPNLLFEDWSTATN